MDSNKDFIEEICHAYFYAKRFIIKRGFAQEIDWQSDIKFTELSERLFLKETAWVILSAGMSEKVISQKFTKVSEAFYNWDDAKRISINKSFCFDRAIKAFGHRKKISAIINLADIVTKKGFQNIKSDLLLKGIDELEVIPYIGPVTKFHLAKNIGLNYSKPDRHLERISRKLGFDSTESLCSLIADKTQEKQSVVDIVIWRYATLNNNYLDNINYLLNRRPFGISSFEA